MLTSRQRLFHSARCGRKTDPGRRAASNVPLPEFRQPRAVVIAGFARTPIGAFCGGLASVPAVQLGSTAISAALRRARLEPEEVEMVVLGQALPSGCGQSPARQASALAEIPPSVDCTGVSKGCASGMKAVMFAAQSVALGLVDIAVAGGMESASQAPYLLRHARSGGYKYGHGTLEDSILQDGMWDSMTGCHLGSCMERTIAEMGITRQEQDAFAVESYRRAAEAWQRGAMDNAVSLVRLPVSAGGQKMHPRDAHVSCDEEYSRLKLQSVAHLPPVFEEGGTITAASASSLNDGAGALVLVAEDRAQSMGLQARYRILSYADHGMSPSEFAVAPAGAMRSSMHLAGLPTVDFYEIHETFAALPIANMRLLKLDKSRVNINGGAVALGNPLGASGANILCSLLNVLEQQEARTGCAAVGNGGGGASAMVVERLQD